MSLRAGLAKVARSVAFASGISPARARARTDLRILSLRGVGPAWIATDLFERAMTYLRRDFDVVSLDHMIDLIESKDGAASGQLALTFEGGYRNSIVLACPILARLDLPATFYVSPGLIERREWLWNHEARERLRGLAPSVVGDLAREVDAPGENIGALLELMTRLGPNIRQPILDEIRRLTPRFDPMPEQRDAYDTIGWDELALLPPDLITVGSQTMTHVDLSTVDRATLEYELVESRRVLERRLGRPVEHFSYPSNDHPPHAVGLARSTYRSAVGAGAGFAAPGADVHLLPRIPMPRSVSGLAWRLDRIGA